MHQFFTLYRYHHLYYVLINILKKWYFLALSLLPRQSSMNHTAHHYPLSQNKGVPRAPATRLSPRGTFPRPGCDSAPGRGCGTPSSRPFQQSLGSGLPIAPWYRHHCGPPKGAPAHPFTSSRCLDTEYIGELPTYPDQGGLHKLFLALVPFSSSHYLVPSHRFPTPGWGWRCMHLASYLMCSHLTSGKISILPTDRLPAESRKND